MRVCAYILVVLGVMLIMVSWKNIDWSVNQCGLYLSFLPMLSQPLIVSRQWIYEAIWFNQVLGAAVSGSGVLKRSRGLALAGFALSASGLVAIYLSLSSIDIEALPRQALGWGLNLTGLAQPVLTLTFPTYMFFHGALMIIGQALAISGAYLARPSDPSVRSFPRRRT